MSPPFTWANHSTLSYKRISLFANPLACILENTARKLRSVNRGSLHRNFKGKGAGCWPAPWRAAHALRAAGAQKKDPRRSRTRGSKPSYEGMGGWGELGSNPG